MDSKLTAGLIIILVKSFLVYLKLFYKGKVEREVLAEVLKEKQDEYERVRKVLEKVDDPRDESIDALRSELLRRSEQR